MTQRAEKKKIRDKKRICWIKPKKFEINQEKKLNKGDGIIIFSEQQNVYQMLDLEKKETFAVNVHIITTYWIYAMKTERK